MLLIRLRRRTGKRLCLGGVGDGKTGVEIGGLFLGLES
jgi:hypothetical protein